MTKHSLALRFKTLMTNFLLASSMVVAGSVSAEEPLKIGFVHVSPVGDAGWTYQHDLGRKAIEEKFGDKIQVKYIESVPEGAEAERVVRDLASSGNKLIFGTSFGFMNPMIKVAKAFPDTHFEHATGYKTEANMGNYNARFYEGRYLAGLVAGSMTQSNTLGYVAAFPIPEVVMGINAYIRGAQSVNPKAEVKVVWINSWFDPGREREAAVALIDQGADILTHHTDSTAVVAAAEEKGKYAIAYHSDMSKYGAKAHLTAVTHHWEQFYIEQVQQALDKTWKPSALWGGVKEGMIGLSALSAAVPKEVADKVEQAKADMIAGKLHPFAGPVVDQEGKERVAAGSNISDEDLSKMDYYVQGVQGKLPK